MSGTKAGAAKGKQTILEQNPNHYSEMGKRSAEAYKKQQEAGTAKPRGWAYNPELARKYGLIAGKKSAKKKG